MPRSNRKADATAKDIADLVAFLPKLSAPGFKPITDWGGGEQDEDGSFVMPWPDYDPVVVEFFRQAGAECWTDHDYEPVEAGRMLEDEELVRAADLSQIRTMLTYCVRGERFGDGHWGAMIEQGHVRRLLERLKEISMISSPPGRTEGSIKTIVLVSCVKKKRGHKVAAEDLYVSPLFRLNLAYAKSLEPDAIYILSAKYGLVPLERQIEPYEVTLNTMPDRDVRIWADHLLDQLQTVANLRQDRFVLLAGGRYRKYLVSHLRHVETPLAGLPIGKQLRRLKELLVASSRESQT